MSKNCTKPYENDIFSLKYSDLARGLREKIEKKRSIS
jgi:hypothetical protein